MRKFETSKKFVIFTGIVFVLSLVYCMGFFTFCVLNDKTCDWTLWITIIGVSSTPFVTSVATYMSKSKMENKIKIQSSFMKEKYKMLYRMGVLTSGRAIDEVENEINKIENNIENIDDNVDNMIM